MSVAQTSTFGQRLAMATAIAPLPVPTSATRMGRPARRAQAASTSCSLASRGVITRPGAVASARPLNVTVPIPRLCRDVSRSYVGVPSRGLLRLGLGLARSNAEDLEPELPTRCLHVHDRSCALADESPSDRSVDRHSSICDVSFDRTHELVLGELAGLPVAHANDAADARGSVGGGNDDF